MSNNNINPPSINTTFNAISGIGIALIVPIVPSSNIVPLPNTNIPRILFIDLGIRFIVDPSAPDVVINPSINKTNPANAVIPYIMIAGISGISNPIIVPNMPSPPTANVNIARLKLIPFGIPLVPNCAFFDWSSLMPLKRD